MNQSMQSNTGGLNLYYYPDLIHYTLTGQKCLNTTKYPCTDCAIYRLNILLAAKMGIKHTGIKSLL